MGEQTAISWCDSTFNLAWGCQKISPGCANCYAEDWAAQYDERQLWGPPQTSERRTFGARYWATPLKWNAQAKRDGVPRRVFCSSMCDIGEDHPVIKGELAKLWPLIRQTDRLIWLLLTKRADRWPEMLPPDWGAGYPNVRLGTSIESPDYLWRLDELAKVPGFGRFVSYEPALQEVDFTPWLIPGNRHTDGLSEFDAPEPSKAIDQIIFGGESGPKHRRTVSIGYLERLANQCLQAGVALFIKQAAHRFPGKQGNIPNHLWAIKDIPW